MCVVRARLLLAFDFLLEHRLLKPKADRLFGNNAFRSIAMRRWQPGRTGPSGPVRVETNYGRDG